MRLPIPPLADSSGIVQAIQDFDPNLCVVLNTDIGCMEVHDRLAHPSQTQVMRVMEPDGRPRQLDHRVLENLRRIRPERQHIVLAEMESQDHAREAAREKDIDQIAEGMASDLKWLGKQWTPSVAWRDRSAAREAIRAEKLS